MKSVAAVRAARKQNLICDLPQIIEVGNSAASPATDCGGDFSQTGRDNSKLVISARRS
jgi:hypothetical protein